MAAANIGGTTIHSFAGIGLGQGTPEALIEVVKKNRKASGRWLRTEVLIIDEGRRTGLPLRKSVRKTHRYA